MKLRNKIKAWIKIVYKKYGTYSITSTILLYSIGLASFVIGALCSYEWVYKAVSTTFLVTVVIVPLFSIGAAFGLQITLLLSEVREDEEKHRREVKFLAALDKCHGKSIVRRNFLGHLLDEWEVRMSKLMCGVVSLKEEYWKVCADLYLLANDLVECTSSIPLSTWETDTALLRYKELQIEKLIERKIPVRRTFILNSIMDDEEAKHFLQITNKQLEEGFCIYYIDLSSIIDDSLKQLLSSDFALIDKLILMLGRQSSINKNVFYYDFFELTYSQSHLLEHEAALNLMSNKAAFLSGSEPPKLHINTYRKKIDEFPLLSQPGYEMEKNAITALVKKLKCW